MTHHYHSPFNYLNALKFLLLFSCLAALSGCESCTPAEDIAQETIKLSQASCPEEACEIGISHGCMEGSNHPAECVDGGNGCGKWVPSSSGACGEGEWCYYAQCFSYDDIPLPEGPGIYPELNKLSPHTLTPSYQGNLTVIPYEAFMNALQLGLDFEESSPTLVDQSKQVTLEANDINTLGIATHFEEAEEFSGDLFLVLMDPNDSGTDWMGGKTTIEARQYFVAAMPGLVGPTSWVGTSPMFVRQSPVAIGAGSCCRGNQPTEACKLHIDHSGPQPECGPIYSTPACLLTHQDIEEFIPTDPGKRPFRVGGSYEEFDAAHNMPRTMRGNGMPAVTLYVSKGRDYHEQLAQDYPNDPVHTSSLAMTMMFEPGVHCDVCNAIECRPEAGGFDETIQVPTVTNPCGVPLGGNFVSKTCQQMSMGSMPSPSCPGVWRGQAHDVWSGPGIAGGTCASGIATRQRTYMDAGANSGVCSGGGTPDWCTHTINGEDQCFCDESCQNQRDQLWVNLMGCNSMSAGNPTSNGSCCGENCACMDAGNGMELCTQCNSNGDCNEFFKGNPHSRYFQDAGENKQLNTDDEGQVDIKCPDNDPDCEEEEVTTSDSSQGSGIDGYIGNTPYKIYVMEEDSYTGSSSATHDKATKPAEKVAETETDEQKVLDSGTSPNVGHAVNSQDLEAASDTSNTITRPGGTPDDDEKPNREAGDPVLLADGRLIMEHHDLVFPGPAMPLNFSRYYSSKDDDRSILGSNWTHSYDSFLVPIKRSSYESWMPMYCVGKLPVTTCVLMHYADGTERLFIRGTQSQGIFYPQAGNGDTLQLRGTFWELHSPDETRMVFNEQGYLITYRDRFKNGYTIIYEPTPIYRIYQRHCRADSVTPEGSSHKQCNDVECRDFSFRDNPDPDFDATRVEIEYPQDIDDNLCGTLASMVGDREPVQLTSMGWEKDLSAQGFTRDGFVLSASRGALFEIQAGLAGTIYTQNNQIYSLFDHEDKDHEYVQWLINVGAGPHAPTGQRKLRPVRVIDDLKRELTFTYYDDLQNKTTYGLLKHVHGPQNATRMTYAYARPTNYPERLQESFLVSATREDLTLPNGVVSQNIREQTFTYNWPENTGSESYDVHEDTYHDAYLDFYSTTFGCKNHPTRVECRASKTTSPGVQVSVNAACVNGTSLQVAGQPIPTGGGGYSVDHCLMPDTTKNPGNPCFLAEQRRHDYISTVADNITAVSLNQEVELESAYDVDPYSQAFERVYAQRYGGLSSAQYPFTNIPDANGPTWQSDLPEFRFDYVASGPDFTNWSDETSDEADDKVDLANFLPASIAARFPMEPKPATLFSKRPSACVMGASTAECTVLFPSAFTCNSNYTAVGQQPYCSREAFDRRYYDLPGNGFLYDYYASTDNSPEPKLLRTRLTCAQLATKHLGNPLHNDLLKFFKPASGSKPDRWMRADGYRNEIEKDLRRICAWVKTTDREGDVIYAGLNFRGQEIVTALAEGLNYIVAEKLVNADGLTTLERHATLATSSWTPADGYTEYIYDELEEEDSAGQPTWDIWRPNVWTKRFNLTRIVEHPKTNDAFDNLGHIWESSTNTLTGAEIATREVLMEYEPLFNQVSRVRMETEDTSGQRETLYHVMNSFDYQEFDPASESFRKALMKLKGWDVRADVNDFDDTLRLPKLVWVQNTIPMHFYKSELNDDGIEGFPNFGSTGEAFAGFVVRRTIFDVNDPTGQTQRSDRIWPAPHGLPARHLSASGSDTRFEYHSFRSNVYGSFPVADADVSIHNRGMLGRVQTRQHFQDRITDDSISAQAGDLFNQGFNIKDCDLLKGAYAWVMPQGCTQDSPATWMASLGIPSSVVNQMLDAPGPEDNLSVTEVRYNTLGHVLAMRRDGQQTVSFVRDTDGRVMESTDAEGVRTVYTRDGRRNPTRIQTFDAQSQLVHQVHQQFDLEGNLLTHCVDVEPNGCRNAMNFGTLVAFDAPRDVGAPNYLLTTWRMTAEGLGWKMMDEMGLERHEEHNARGLTTAVIWEPGTNKERRIEYDYDTRSRLTETRYGSSDTRTAHGQQNTKYGYDGFDQLRSIKELNEVTKGSGGFTDLTWYLAYSPRGERVAMKLDAHTQSAPYSLSSTVQGANVEQEYLTQYDGYGRPVVMQEHNVQRTTLDYDERGYVRSRQVQAMDNGVVSAGDGQIDWMHYDARGRLAWHLNQRGDMNISVYDVPGRKSAFISMQRDQVEKTWVVTTSEQDFDVRGDLTQHLVTGQFGELQPTTYTHDALGRVDSVTTPDQKTTSSVYNMVGWPKQVTEPGESGQMSPVTDYIYNARGQVLSVTEPGVAGEITTYTYNIFGERTSRQLPNAPEFDAYTYDGYGRMARHTKKNVTNQLYAYHDYTYHTLLDGSRQMETFSNVPGSGLANTDQVITLDRLGRVTSTEERNMEASLLEGRPHNLVVKQLYEHDALGRLTQSTQTLMSNNQVQTIDSILYEHDVDASTGMWTQTTTYPSGTKWVKELNTSGQLESMTRSHVDGVGQVDPMQAQMNWVGGLYAGRAQFYEAGIDPLRELRTFDGLGRTQEWTYRAVDLNGSNNPFNTSWGDTYCQDSWQSVCEMPLLATSLRYDTMDRVVSERRQFGHPGLDGSGQLMRPQDHLRRWRGYDYNGRGFLSTEWQVSDITDVRFDSVPNHVSTTSQRIGASNGGEQWDWLRNATGDLTRIAPGPGNTQSDRWTHVNTAQGGHDRLTRHELDQIKVPSLSQPTIGYDGRRRITYDGEHDYTWDAHGRLIKARDHTANSEEYYYYDATGELVLVERNNPQGNAAQRERFVYDGVQKVAMYRDHSTINFNGDLVWEAAWGDGLDNLISWRHVEHSGGARTYIPLRDHRQNVVGLWDTADKKLVGLSDYTAQGHRITMSEDEVITCHEEFNSVHCDALAGAFPFGFNTAWRSPLTGISQMRQRWYSPTLGQFLSHDPLEYIDSFNMFAFALRDPVNVWDPYGLSGSSIATEPSSSCSRFSLRRCDVADGMERPVGRYDTTARPPANLPESSTPLYDQDENLNGWRYRPSTEDYYAHDFDQSGRYIGKTPVGDHGLEVPEMDPLDLIPGRAFGSFLVKKVGKPVGKAAVWVAKKGWVGLKWVGKKSKKGIQKGWAWGKNKARNLRGRIAGWFGKNPCGKNSFEGDTPVLMCDGSLVPIDELEEGDWVWARDPVTGLESCEQITQTFLHEDGDMMALELEQEASGQRQRLILTHDHPMITPDGESVPVYQLEPGQRLGGHLHDLRVVSVQRLDLVVPAYNLSVDFAHTFFVGDPGVWAHNCFKKPKSWISYKKVTFMRDREGHIHLLRNHSPHRDGYESRSTSGTSNIYSVFDDNLSDDQILDIVRKAYKNVDEKVKFSSRGGSKYKIRGNAGGYRIEMWYNNSTKQIETAYPIGLAK